MGAVGKYFFLRLMLKSLKMRDAVISELPSKGCLRLLFVLFIADLFLNLRKSRFYSMHFVVDSLFFQPC